MTALVQHAHKSVTVRAVKQALEANGVLLRVLENVSPDARIALEEPTSRKLHPGSVLDETMACVAKLLGPSGVEKVMFNATERTLAGVVEPLARVFMALSPDGPGALLARFETLISAGAYGFGAKWIQTEPRAGRLVISTLSVLPVEADHTWKGTVEFLLVWAKVKGVVQILPREAGGRDVCLRVSWEPGVVV